MPVVVNLRELVKVDLPSFRRENTKGKERKKSVRMNGC
jgi:hypothetical protein